MPIIHCVLYVFNNYPENNIVNLYLVTASVKARTPLLDLLTYTNPNTIMIVLRLSLQIKSQALKRAWREKNLQATGREKVQHKRPPQTRRPDRSDYRQSLRVVQACGIHIYECRPFQIGALCRSSGVEICFPQPSCKHSTACPRHVSGPGTGTPAHPLAHVVNVRSWYQAEYDWFLNLSSQKRACRVLWKKIVAVHCTFNYHMLCQLDNRVEK